MPVLKIDPPPATNDINVLRNYVSDLYDALYNTIHNLDSDNFNEDFINSLKNIESGE